MKMHTFHAHRAYAVIFFAAIVFPVLCGVLQAFLEDSMWSDRIKNSFCKNAFTLTSVHQETVKPAQFEFDQ
jgi:hypothetical protein